MAHSWRLMTLILLPCTDNTFNILINVLTTMRSPTSCSSYTCALQNILIISQSFSTDMLHMQANGWYGYSQPHFVVHMILVVQYENYITNMYT